MVVGPVRVVIGGYEIVGTNLHDISFACNQNGRSTRTARLGVVETHLESILPFRIRPTDGNNLLSPERLRIQKPKVPQPTHTDDTHLLPWTTPILLQRTIHRNAAAQHRRGVLGGDSIWDLEDEMRWPAPVVRIATFADFAVGVLAVIGVDGRDRAVVLHTAGAFVAVATEAGG